MMKTKIITILMLLMGIFAMQNANASVCSFLDSNGDCLTTIQELNDAKALASLKTITCAWSNCQYTLDVNGDGIITTTDVNLIKSMAQLKTVTIDGAPSNINLEFINSNTQLKITITDSDGTLRSDVNVNFIVNEYPDYNGTSITDANGELIVDVPSDLVYKRVTAKVWFDSDVSKQIPYTENSIAYVPVNQAPILDPLIDITVNEGDLVTITPTATDLNDDIITYTYTILNSNGQWQTDFNSASIYTVIVTADDGFGLTDSKQFTLTVNDVLTIGNQGSSSGGGGGGGHNYEPKECVSTPTGTTEIKGDVKIVYVEDSCTGEVTSFEENLSKPKVQPIIPVETENNAEQNVNSENQNQVTGFAVTDLAKKNPVTTGVILIIILGLSGYGIYWLRK